MAPLVVTFVTGNQNKLKEVRAIIGEEHAAKFILEAKAVDLPELQGEPEDIAKEKVMLAAKDIGGED
jgi:inosine triphosphate pyrophosphatase